MMIVDSVITDDGNHDRIWIQPTQYYPDEKTVERDPVLSLRNSRILLSIMYTMATANAIKKLNEKSLF